jgi:hypothetical protein
LIDSSSWNKRKIWSFFSSEIILKRSYNMQNKPENMIGTQKHFQNDKNIRKSHPTAEGSIVFSTQFLCFKDKVIIYASTWVDFLHI